MLAEFDIKPWELRLLTPYEEKQLNALHAQLQAQAEEV